MKKLILFLLLLATSVHAETYKWTDSAGTIHFSESLAEVPAGYRNSAKPLEISTSTASPAAPATPSKNSNDFSGVAALKDRMLQDQGTMEQIRALQNDPEMQALLSNPDVIRAVQSGDYSVLVTNPAFLRLLNNPRVKEIGKRMQ